MLSLTIRFIMSLYSIYISYPSKYPYMIVKIHIPLTSVREMMVYWSIPYRSKLYTAFHINSIGAINPVIKFIQWPKQFTSTPLERPSKVVLHVYFPSLPFIFPPIIYLYILSFLRSWQNCTLHFSFPSSSYFHPFPIPQFHFHSHTLLSAIPPSEPENIVF